MNIANVCELAFVECVYAFKMVGLQVATDNLHSRSLLFRSLLASTYYISILNSLTSPANLLF